MIEVCVNNGHLVSNPELDRSAHQGIGSPEQLQVSSCRDRQSSLQNIHFQQETTTQAVCRYDTFQKNKRRKRFACPVFYLKLPLLGRWQGGTKRETRIPWLMDVKAPWKKAIPFPILLPSQPSIDYYFSPFLPLWHTQQVRFTHNTH